MGSATEEEYVDSSFEWSFIELTERMHQLLKDDRHSIMKTQSTKKPVFFSRLTDSGMVRRVSKESDQNSANMLDILPKTISMTNKRPNYFKEELDKWSFDIFSLSYATNGHPLQALSHEIFTMHGLLSAFQLTEDVFMRFIIQVEKHYKLNPYHNACHAADVLQTANCMICKTGFASVMNPLEKFCLLLTTIVHDIEHTGTNNSFHKNTGSELAKLYVVSVLENHHLRLGLRLLQEYDILKSLDGDRYEEFQYMLVTMILATDMANHFLLITNMKLMLTMPARCKKRTRIKRVMLMLMHCADISNPAKPWDLHKSWVSLLIEEFFLQGDKERELKLPITPNCDRYTANIATLQIGFMQTFSKETFVVTDQLMEQELVQSGHNYIRYMPWHDCMEENMTKWSGKWKFLKYEQINELLAEAAKPRLSMVSASKGPPTEKGNCLCCGCGKKRPIDDDTSYVTNSQ